MSGRIKYICRSAKVDDLYLSKQNFLKRKLENLRAEDSRKLPGTFKEEIGFLVDADVCSDFNFLRNLAQELSASAGISIVAYSKEKRKTGEDDQLWFSNSDFTRWGTAKSSKLIDFTAQPFRFLISYYQRENVFLDFLKATSQAAFKIGFQQKSYDCFHDLTIQVKLDQTELFKAELIKYLKIVNRID